MRLKQPYILVLLTGLLVANTGFAQLRNPFSNTFFSLDAGGNCYINSYGKNFGFGGDVTFGKWLINTAGLRCQFSGQMADDGHRGSQMCLYGHVDIFFDLFTSIKGRNPSDRFRSYVLTGVGIVHSMAGDNDFCGSLGMGAEYKIGEDWRLFGEVGGFLQPSEFDENVWSSFLATAKVGVIYDICVNPTRSRSRWETKRFGNDWFFHCGIGASSFNYRGIESMSERLELMTPIFEFGLGKRLTSAWCIRLDASGLYARSGYELFSYYNIHGDIMLDMVGLFRPDRPLSRFTGRPYLSASVLSRLDDQRHFLFAPAVGTVFAFSPNSRNEYYLDLRYLVSPPRFAQVDESQSKLSVGLATVMVGYSYNFAKRSFR